VTCSTGDAASTVTKLDLYDGNSHRSWEFVEAKPPKGLSEDQVRAAIAASSRGDEASKGLGLLRTSGSWKFVGKFVDVAGDVGTLSPLVDLTDLHLTGTKVDGDVKGLAPLVQLAYLSLQNTKVAGDVHGLSPLGQLTHLSLYNTKVVGQAAALEPLVRLAWLNLEGTAVAKCDAFCAVGGQNFHQCSAVQKHTCSAGRSAAQCAAQCAKCYCP
jgi:hypothetical protein